jgi:hypothetical protein
MSNNKQMIKLYTQEQVKLMIDDAHNGVDGYYDILKKHNPIELPSDEEIEKFALEKYHSVEDSRWYEPLQVGAKWMRDKIGGGNND